ncbi:Late embryogenesis abundant protein LEA-2 subgroup domain-containing protein [Dioscorea alata]|uniref:Late embryogenesis abundant protein LEA-2 subgroup domain-containing protein n=1 Tax=Dioscorea alata TaxID=55571 RepID=A0ACB7U0W1_DIOAL|nr:Late embryogenesis abundant protein LEA-2 subgroup domain-containing protein [Dioscorea alata]
MADKIHPSEDSEPSTEALLPPKPNPPTYIIQLPKDQIYRIPPPENAALFEFYSHRASRRRRSCRRCLLYSLLSLLILFILLAATLTILYFTLRPRLPSNQLSHLYLNSSLTSSSSSFLASFLSENRNTKISFRYLSGGSLSLSYSGTDLATGVWPAFKQSTRNVTSFNVTINGAGVRLPQEMVTKRGTVALAVDVTAPVKFKLGSVSTWAFTVKTRCDVTVDGDGLTAKPMKMVSNACRVRLRL